MYVNVCLHEYNFTYWTDDLLYLILCDSLKTRFGYKIETEHIYWVCNAKCIPAICWPSPATELVGIQL